MKPAEVTLYVAHNRWQLALWYLWYKWRGCTGLLYIRQGHISSKRSLYARCFIKDSAVYHSRDAEEELCGNVSDQIAREIDNQILAEISQRNEETK